MKFKNLKIPDDKNIGIFFTLIFLFFSFFYFLKNSISLSIFFSSIFLVLLIITATKPILLRPLNKSWMLLGYLLGQLVSPIFLGILFFFIITPTSLLMKLFGRDELNLKKVNNSTFWKIRDPVGPNSKSFNQQF